METTCKNLLTGYLQTKASEYSPLHDNTQVELKCTTKFSETVQGRPASDVGYVLDCTMFLDFLISVAMTKVPQNDLLSNVLAQLESVAPVEMFLLSS